MMKNQKVGVLETKHNNPLRVNFGRTDRRIYRPEIRQTWGRGKWKDALMGESETLGDNVAVFKPEVEE